MSKAFYGLKRLGLNVIFMLKCYNASIKSCRNYSTMQDPGRIHILGHGNIGRFFAHALVTAPTPAPVTLLFYRPSLHEEWDKVGHRIEIKGISKFLPDIPPSSSGYDIEIIDPKETTLPKIQNLIITTKTASTVEALNSIANRLTPETTLLIAQNGMGVTTKISEQVLPKLEPECVQGYKANCLGAIITHGVYSNGPFRSILAGYGDIVIGHHYPASSPSNSKYLLETIINAPLLNARAQTQTEFMISVYRKLVVNSTINPLSVVFQRKNGDLFNHKLIYELMRILVDEMHSIYSRTTEFGKELSRENLERLVLSVAEKTAQNTSSMLQDFQAGRETEIEYLNGWFTKQLPDERSCNHILLDLVKERKTLKEDQICEVFGLEWSSSSGNEVRHLRKKH